MKYESIFFIATKVAMFQNLQVRLATKVALVPGRG